jgi:hypothetical protein
MEAFHNGQLVKTAPISMHWSSCLRGSRRGEVYELAIRSIGDGDFQVNADLDDMLASPESAQSPNGSSDSSPPGALDDLVGDRGDRLPGHPLSRWRGKDRRGRASTSCRVSRAQSDVLESVVGSASGHVSAVETPRLFL